MLTKIATLVAAVGLSLMLGAPSVHADGGKMECVSKIDDSSHTLSVEDWKQISDTIGKVEKDTGADIYVRIWNSYLPDYEPAGFAESSASHWWNNAVATCPNWKSTSGAYAKDNVVVIGVSTLDKKALIAYGSKFDTASIRINTMREDALTAQVRDGHTTSAIVDTLNGFENAVENSHHDEVSWWWILGIVILGIVIGVAILMPSFWMMFSGSSEKSTPTSVKPTRTEPPKMSKAEARKRIAEVVKVRDQLDFEWVQYETDTAAYYLEKPILRDMNVAVVKKYHELMFDLRSNVDALNDKVDEKKLKSVERLAETTLEAWSAADTYALKVGVSDMSITERAALRRLHGLIAQLADPATPRTMWDNLKEGIEREMGKLTTVPVSWNQVAALPEIVASGSVQHVLEGRHRGFVRS